MLKQGQATQAMDKSEAEHQETVEHRVVGSEAAHHGDRALAVIGDERITLTEEDVCAKESMSLSTLFTIETLYHSINL